MTINYKGFRISKLKQGEFFDLEKLATINGKDGERQEYKILSYGIPFHRVIEKVVDYELQEYEGNYTIKEFLEIYERIVNDLADEFE